MVAFNSKNIDGSIDFTIWSFNCKGVKSSFNCIDDVITKSQCNLMFLCAHWLTPREVSCFKKELSDKKLWNHMKSSIDPEEQVLGRPYGGIGFIGKRVQGITYKPVSVDSDRITGVQLISGDKTLFTIFGVYLPYYNGHMDQIELYNETLDILQSTLDTMDPSPVLIVGDMNASLPNNDLLARNWHRRHPYTKHSFMLYDFLRNNDLLIANFNFAQSIDYTYFNDCSTSYIDHVFCSAPAMDSTKNCSIIHDWASNTSDHHPISTTIELCIRESSDNAINELNKKCKKYPWLNWSDSSICSAYTNKVAQMAMSLKTVNIDNISNKENALRAVNFMCENLADVIHGACDTVISEKQTPYKGRFKKKNWWNTDCLIARDKQRFWFRLWKNLDRPRSGQVYLCYKSAKKTYRRVCNESMNNRLHKFSFHLNTMYSCRNMKKFWNCIRNIKQDKGKDESSISIKTLHEHYTSKFGLPDYNSDVISAAKANVDLKYDLIKDKVFNSFVMSESMVGKYIKRLNCGCAPGPDGIMSEHLKYATDSNMLHFLSVLFSLCLKFGIVPRSFTEGWLVPLLKKSTLDPRAPNHYRPLTLSCTLSKILELYLLDVSGHHDLSDLQFGFVKGRSTMMAASLANDVISYCNKRGSPVYTCSLDAEGAFDAVPHDILFYKVIGVIPDHCWLMLVRWY